MQNQLINKSQIELEILIFTIELMNTQFSQYTPENILQCYNEELEKVDLAISTLTIMEKKLKKLQKIKIIAKFYTIDKDCILACYKINYPIKHVMPKLSHIIHNNVASGVN
ncbi:plasmid maintenance protein [Borreliella bavariensis]|uniref:plasmid maintenance protein n=1 Tax=Borreliella bavariensis TaxID=664662 RepID=UPI001C02DEDB|nr:plasmid maintenance protein [Borreliella bavariensis]